MGLFLYVCIVHRLGGVVGTVSTSFDKDMSLHKLVDSQKEVIYLQCVFSRETLVAARTWEWFDSQMDSFMTFQVVVPIEALWTLVTFEWSVLIVYNHTSRARTHHSGS